MRPQIDLHTHSTASDGTLTPEELVQQAANAGVQVLALTDHDTLGGLDAAQRAATECSLIFVPGVEISVTWEGGTVHVLGLRVDPEHPRLRRGLVGLRRFRDWRAQEIGRRLARDAGLQGAFSGALALSNGKLVSRTHFARWLVAEGHAASVGGVFKKFLKAGKPGHVPGQWASLQEAVTWIGAAGGQAVIAHPARYRLTRSKLRRLIGEFIACGGSGLEVVSGCHSCDDYFQMAKHANDFAIMSSVGSDFHSPEQARIALGHLPALPARCQPIWHDWPEAA
jgi:predicted metal-dependent phosphoesterase TrpH